MWLLTDVLQMQAAITPTATLWSPPFLGAGPSIVEVSNAPIPVAWWIVGCFFGGSRLGPIEDGTPYQPIGKASQSLQSHSSSTWVGTCVGTAGTPNNIIWVCLILWYFKFIFLLKLPCGGIPYTPFSDTPIYIYIHIYQSKPGYPAVHINKTSAHGCPWCPSPHFICEYRRFWPIWKSGYIRIHIYI